MDGLRIAIRIYARLCAASARQILETRERRDGPEPV